MDMIMGGVIVESPFRVGVDVGSTTIKLVVLGEEHAILYKNYARHFSEIGKAHSRARGFFIPSPFQGRPRSVAKAVPFLSQLS